jgi:hypothetical protein
VQDLLEATHRLFFDLVTGRFIDSSMVSVSPDVDREG